MNTFITTPEFQAFHKEIRVDSGNNRDIADQRRVNPSLEVLRRALAAIATFMVRRAERRASRQLARLTELSLGALDARGLRDLGLMRSEISSVATEIAEEPGARSRRISMLHL